MSQRTGGSGRAAHLHAPPWAPPADPSGSRHPGASAYLLVAVHGRRLGVMPDESGLFSPSECGDYGAGLDEALRRIAGLGIAFHPASRLHREAALLTRVARDDAFPSTRERRAAVAHAMADAADWFDISQTFDADVVQRIWADVRQAAKGDVGDPRQGATAYRLQSQLWWGSLLWRGGATPRPVPAVNGRKSPDFEVENASATYGVEAKRPENADSARRAVRLAAEQLEAHGVPGCVAIDLSECVQMQDVAFAATATQQLVVTQQALESFAAVLQEIIDDVEIAHEDGSTRMQHVLAIFGVVRGFAWDHSRNGVSLLATTGGRLFAPTTHPSVAYDHMATVLDQMTLGMREVGYDVTRFKDVLAEQRSATR